MPINGLPNANANACAAFKPISSAFGSPGPCVAATASTSSASICAERNALRETGSRFRRCSRVANSGTTPPYRSEEHTSELQSLTNLVCRLLLEKKKEYTSLTIRDAPYPLTDRTKDKTHSVARPEAP